MALLERVLRVVVSLRGVCTLCLVLRVSDGSFSFMLLLKRLPCCPYRYGTESQNKRVLHKIPWCFITTAEK